MVPGRSGAGAGDGGGVAVADCDALYPGVGGRGRLDRGCGCVVSMGALWYVLPALLAGLAFGWLLGSRSRPVRSSTTASEPASWVVVHTEDLSYAAPCRVTDGGIEPLSDELGRGWTVPDSAVVRRLRVGAHTLYLVLAERIALMNMRDMDIARRSLLARSAPAMKPGGDSLQLARAAAVGLPVLLSLYMAFTLQSLGPSLSTVAAMGAPLQALSNQVDTLSGSIADGVPCAAEPFDQVTP